MRIQVWDHRTWFIAITLLSVLAPAAGAAEKSGLGNRTLAARFQAMALLQFDLDRDGRLSGGEKIAATRVLAAANESGGTVGELRRQALLQFDRNRNGELDRPEIRNAVLSVDTGSDSPTDAKTARSPAARRAKRIQGNPSSLIQRFDRNRNGVLDPAEAIEAERAQWQMMQQAQAIAATGASSSRLLFGMGMGQTGGIASGTIPAISGEGAPTGGMCSPETTDNSTTPTAQNAGALRGFGGQRAGRPSSAVGGGMLSGTRGTGGGARFAGARGGGPRGR